MENLKTLLETFNLLKPFHRFIYFYTLIEAFKQGSTVLSTIFFAKSIDGLVATDGTAIHNLYLAFGFATGRVLLSYAGDYILIHKYRWHGHNHLQEESFRRVLRLNISQLYEEHSALKLQVFNNGERAVMYFSELFFFTLVPLIFMLTFSLSALTYYSPMLAVFTIAVLLVVTTASYFFTLYMRPIMKKNIDAWDIQSKIRMESFQHLQLVKTIGASERFIKDYIDKRKLVTSDSIDGSSKRNNFGLFRRLTLGTSEYVIFGYTFIKIISGALPVGSIFAIVRFVGQSFDKVVELQTVMRDTPIQYIYLEKYLNVIRRVPAFNEAGKKKFEMGDIKIENLTFKYGTSESSSLCNVNIVFKKGETTALVGSSGSGKTTIIKLLLRMYDYTNGSIKIGENELRSLDATVWRNKVGYVEQHVDLFDDTIRRNLTVAMPKSHLSDKDLKEVAKISRIDEFYHRIKDKMFDTHIGERGIKLSGGERQRIGIARAIIRNPDLFIFDEATSALDSINEVHIRDAIKDASVGRTTIIIAHRLSTIIHADKIVVMDKGKVVATGNHDELMQTSEYYKELINHQSF